MKKLFYKAMLLTCTLTSNTSHDAAAADFLPRLPLLIVDVGSGRIVYDSVSVLFPANDCLTQTQATIRDNLATDLIWLIKDKLNSNRMFLSPCLSPAEVLRNSMPSKNIICAVAGNHDYFSVVCTEITNPVTRAGENISVLCPKAISNVAWGKIARAWRTARKVATDSIKRDNNVPPPALPELKNTPPNKPGRFKNFRRVIIVENHSR